MKRQKTSEATTSWFESMSGSRARRQFCLWLMVPRCSWLRVPVSRSVAEIHKVAWNWAAWAAFRPRLAATAAPLGMVNVLPVTVTRGGVRIWPRTFGGRENPHRALRALKGAGKGHYVRIDLGVGCKGDTSGAGHKVTAAVRPGGDGGIGGTMGQSCCPVKGGDRPGEGAFGILGQGRGP
jgi:hypothetical protein